MEHYHMYVCIYSIVFFLYLNIKTNFFKKTSIGSFPFKNKKKKKNENKIK